MVKDNIKIHDYTLGEFIPNKKYDMNTINFFKNKYIIETIKN